MSLGTEAIRESVLSRDTLRGMIETRDQPREAGSSARRRLAEDAGLRDTDSFPRSWHILVQGSIVVSAEGDAQAARRGKAMARQLIDQYR
jgi:hypothetical protein